MSKKRTLDSTGDAALAPAGLTSRRRVTRANVYDQVEEFRQFFKDPPNADALDRGDSTPDAAGVASSMVKGQFRGLRFLENHTNASRIYLAVQFLRDHLQDPTQPPYDFTFFFGTPKESGVFWYLAKELEKKVPMLKGVTGFALRYMYVQIVERRRELETFLKTVITTRMKATGEPWVSTRLSEMAWDLVLAEDAMRARQEQRKTAEKEGWVVEVLGNGEKKRMDRMGVARQAKEDVRPFVQSISSSSTTTYADVPSALDPLAQDTVPSVAPSPSPPQEQPPPQQPLPAPSDSVAVVSLTRLTRQVSSLSSQGKTLSPADEQEILPEEAFDRMLALERIVQHLSSEVESQQAMFETSLQQQQRSIQAIETKDDTTALMNRIQALEIKAVDDTALIARIQAVETKVVDVSLMNNIQALETSNRIDALETKIDTAMRGRSQGLETEVVGTTMIDRIQALETKVDTVMMDISQELESAVDTAVMNRNQTLENELVIGMTKGMKGIRTLVTRVETAMTDRLEALDTAMMDRIQALERTVHAMDEKIKGMESTVKELKKTVDRSFTDLPSRLQVMNDRIHFLEKHSINTMS
ncbi:MAG: hypothetical protein J3Q66DRAFT_392614 [Benniella sp.]|nr:MAG: hypothetical protein J3Q66DRAFT_392614 [Benniella sp.]